MTELSTTRILDWMERAVVGVLSEAGIEPDADEPARTRRATLATDDDAAKYAAFIFQNVQALRSASDPDRAAQLGLITMYTYMEARERFGWGMESEARQHAATLRAAIPKLVKSAKQKNRWRRR